MDTTNFINGESPLTVTSAGGLATLVLSHIRPFADTPKNRDDLASPLAQYITSAARLFGVEIDADGIARLFLSHLDGLEAMLLLDLRAALDGDPAATCQREIVLCYPGFFATSVYRTAHILYRLGVPFLPRLMTEHAHRKTGVDIHPGAEIGRQFFIDHGTGVVIGETATVGNRVRIYQGVTLGAKSIRTDENGRAEKGGKRHPTVGDDVIIYAGATVLGGNTVIGNGSVIGAGVFITTSVEPDSIVIYTPECKKRENKPHT